MIVYALIALAIFNLFLAVLVLSIAHRLYRIDITVGAIERSTHQVVMPNSLADQFVELTDEDREKMTRVPEDYEAIQ